MFSAVQALSLITSVNRDATLKAIVLTTAAASLALVLGSRTRRDTPGAGPAGAVSSSWDLFLPAAAVVAALADEVVVGVGHLDDPARERHVLPQLADLAVRLGLGLEDQGHVVQHAGLADDLGAVAGDAVLVGRGSEHRAPPGMGSRRAT